MKYFLPAILFSGFLFTVPTQAQEGASLMRNGDLEESNGQDWPTGKGVSIEEEDGNHFLRLKSPEPGTQVQAYRKITIPAGTSKLNVSFRARFEDVKEGAENWHTARVILHFKDDTEQLLQPDPKPFAFKGDSNGWLEKTVELSVPEGATSLEFLPALFQVDHGTLDIDDVMIVPDPA